jgi:molecular chaperone GrpE
VSSFSDADRERDATPVEPAGPVADTDPPAAEGHGMEPSGDDGSTVAASSDPPPADRDAVDGGDGVDDDGADELASEIEAEIRELAAERDTFKDIAQRTLADFENYKKRVQAQIRDEADRATGRLAEALLPVLDAAEAAYLRHPDEIGPLLNLMLGELRKHGLETLDLEGHPFDPEVADAVAHEPGDGGEVVVTEVLRSGYRWKDRTLRAAMVRTADRTPAGEDVAPGER